MFTEGEKRALRNTIQANKHEAFVVSLEEMDAIVKSAEIAGTSETKERWAKIRERINFGASHLSSAGTAYSIASLVNELGGSRAEVYVKSYGGKPHIILKGRPGLRKILTGTKYGLKNPKVVSMGLGKLGATSAAKSGGLFTVVFLSAYRVADYFLTDNSTMSSLVGHLATDIVKVGITTGVSIVAVSAVASLTTLAIGPLFVVLIVGVGLSVLLDYVDNKLGITNSVIIGLEALLEKLHAAGNQIDFYVEQQKRKAWEVVGNAVDEVLYNVVGYVLDSAKSAAIDWGKEKLREFSRPTYW